MRANYAYMNRNIALSTQRQHTTRLGDRPIECIEIVAVTFKHTAEMCAAPCDIHTEYLVPCGVLTLICSTTKNKMCLEFQGFLENHFFVVVKFSFLRYS